MSRVVLVTGANRGIGLACASAFVANGDTVAVTYRSELPPASLADNVLCVKCDVTDAAQVEAAFLEIEEKLGPVEVLVSNAGMTVDKLAIRMSDDDFASVLDANLVGGFRVAKRAVQKMMRARQGRIIFIGSVVGATGQAGQANYAASKAGLIGLARSLAREFASRNITVNVVSPGPVATDMFAAVSDEARTAITDAVPLGRLAEPSEIAAAVTFLASDPAAFITGAVLPVDGGLGMGAI
jgi:3-oxoacyl-[acyl-carrier protein] reductase